MTLPSLIASERERLGLSLRQVADRSGGMLSATAVHDIEQGRVQQPSDRALEGIAKGLSLPKDAVYEAAGAATSDDPKPFTLPKRASRLNRKEREHVLQLVDLLLERRTRR